MNCRDFEAALERARDEHLAPEAARALEAHAQGCAPCARVQRTEQRLREAFVRLRGHAHAAAPLGFEAGVLRRIAAPRQRPWAWPLTAAAALAAATLAGALLLRGGDVAVPDAARALAPPSAPRAGARVVPVTWSNGEVDVVGPAAPAPEDRPVAVVVEWNL